MDKSFPSVLKVTYMMHSSDICEVGAHLGYDWNLICDEIGKAEFYAQDGDGSFTVHRSANNKYTDDSAIINEIFTEIFKHYPVCSDISVVN